MKATSCKLLVKAINNEIINEGERQKQNQETLEDAMNLLTTKQFRTYLEMRQRIIPKLVEIQLLETKNPQDIQSLVRDSLL